MMPVARDVAGSNITVAPILSDADPAAQPHALK
jgi:hypothetical protein